jgi:hypothetical protein
VQELCLIGLGGLLAHGEYLDPAEPLNFSDNLCEVVPVYVGEWREEVNFEAPQLGALFILFFKLFLLVCG